MAELIVRVMNGTTPAPGLADDPEITIRRTDTGAAVVSGSAMTDLGDGLYRFSFTPSGVLNYGWVVDADPNVTGQVPSQSRHYDGVLSCEGVQLAELWKLLGLDPTDIVTITPTSIVTTLGTFTIALTGDGVNTTTMTRT